MKSRRLEPVIFDNPDIELDRSCHDGRIQPLVGVHSYQVHRANRKSPPDCNHRGNTYNHQPMLSHWKGRFYLQFLAAHHNEHEGPTETFLTTSSDGRHWSPAEVIFPYIEYKIYHYAIAHQRMGFYVAPNGRLLTASFYGVPRDGHLKRMPNSGNGIGRAVREIYDDGSQGPIHFLRYMPKSGYTKENTSHWYPFFRDSSDSGFVDACNALLEDKLVHQQMWEEDRNNDDGFFALHWTDDEYATGKALTFWTNPDGSVTGFWKGAFSSTTEDRGKTWSDVVSCPTINCNTSKYWGQKLKNGRYAFVYNDMEGKLRSPLVSIQGDDGQHFSKMRTVLAEMPPVRFGGWHKDLGQQYTRGIIEGNGQPEGPYFWLSYSINKEDIWVSRIPENLSDSVQNQVDDQFDEAGSAAILDFWNIYCGCWGDVSIEEVKGNLALKISDEDPYDYVKLFRVFPEQFQVKIKFALVALPQTEDPVEIDILNKTGHRPVRLKLAPGRERSAGEPETDNHVLPLGENGDWVEIEITIDAKEQKYSVNLDGKPCLSDESFSEAAESVHRLEIRTGCYRMEEPRPYVAEPEFCVDEVDPDPDHRKPTVAYAIRYLKTESLTRGSL